MGRHPSGHRRRALRRHGLGDDQREPRRSGLPRHVLRGLRRKRRSRSPLRRARTTSPTFWVRVPTRRPRRRSGPPVSRRCRSRRLNALPARSPRRSPSSSRRAGGPQRRMNGEAQSTAIAMMALLTGQVACPAPTPAHARATPTASTRDCRQARTRQVLPDLPLAARREGREGHPR